MAVPTLYEICLRKTETQLRSGIWRDRSPNAFSNLPSRIVDELMARVGSRHVNGGPIKLPDLLVLLGSEKLTHLRLNSLGTKHEYDLFLQKIQTFPNFCKHIRVITLHLLKGAVKSSLVETLLRMCPDLEELDSTIIPTNFEVFKNCKALKSLRFRANLGPLRESVDISHLAYLERLEILSFEGMDCDTTVKILQHCPKLVSIQDNDSLRALKRLHEKSMENPSSTLGHFQLRRCLWRNDFSQYWRDLSKEIATFSEKIRCAVSLCPLVEDLTVCPLKGESLGDLRNLHKLQVLKIDFLCCVDSYTSHFDELLQEIGHQLKLLFVVSNHPISVDTICERCPNLLALDIDAKAIVSNPTQKNPDLPLEKLRVASADQESLLYLLSNCKLLEELILGDVLCFDDGLLNQILAVNRLERLKEIAFSKCSLSREGFKTLLQKTHCLRRVLATEHLLNIVENLIGEMNLDLRSEYFQDLATLARRQYGLKGVSHFSIIIDDLKLRMELESKKYEGGIPAVLMVPVRFK